MLVKLPTESFNQNLEALTEITSKYGLVVFVGKFVIEIVCDVVSLNSAIEKRACWNG